MIGNLQYIYIYYCILSIMNLYVMNIHKSSSGRVFVYSSHTKNCRPRCFCYIFLQLKLQVQALENWRCASQTKKVNTLTPWEPWKTSFLGLSAHISRAEKPSFFMEFRVQRYTVRPGVFVGCFTLQATKSKIPAKTRIIKQFQIVELVFTYIL